MYADIGSLKLAIFGSMGMPELIIVFLIILVLFGAKKIPGIAKDIGGGIREFKKSISGEGDEEKKDK
ncbi:MAG: twin-arginine translocase TatA/TatE family subunit [bacterium]|nr:twin-arginine translocase TatA/TatE family subunit [bacterium]